MGLILYAMLHRLEHLALPKGDEARSITARIAAHIVTCQNKDRQRDMDMGGQDATFSGKRCMSLLLIPNMQDHKDAAPRMTKKPAP